MLTSPLTAAEPRPLAGRRVVISAGHGYYLNDTSRWVLQRSPYFGIVEDFVNHDIVTDLYASLLEVGADVYSTRNLDRNAGLGESGFPKWQEAARYHLKAIGAPESVWNGSGGGHLGQDINSRPRYANFLNAELLVSVHNNGGLGTGTETWYETNNASAVQSKRLADLVHAAVMTAIRRDFDPAWVDRRVKGAAGTYGENSVATRPAILVEVAFMDRATPDNAALQVDRFKRIVATAIRDGIREYLVGAVPAAPATLLAASDATSVHLAWTDRSSDETGFRLERQAAAGGPWSSVATVAANLTSFRDSSVTPGTTYVYRVTAFNAAGDAADFANEATATLLAPAPTLVLATVTPASPQTRTWGQDVEFTVTVTDHDGRPVIAPSLLVQDGLRNTTLTSLTADATGPLTFRSPVPSGQANGVYAFTFQATKAGFTTSASITRQISINQPVTPTALAGAPTLFVQPAPLAATAGAHANFSVTARGEEPLSYQWHYNGTALPGATAVSLTLPAVTPAHAGSYTVALTNRLGTTTSLAAPLVVHPSAWLSNLSVRTTLATGQTVIVGLVVNGGAKDLLVRAAGPALAGFGLTSAMPDPRLELFRDSTRIALNNDWPASLATSFAAVGAFPFTAASRDAALLNSLSGAHTVQATGSAGGTVLIEGYDAGTGSATRLINLSARNRVGTGADVLIAGFTVSGTGTQRVLIRAVGPTLSALGVPAVLADPQLELNDPTGVIATDDNWDAALAPVFAQVGAFPLPTGSKDSALIATLTAGRNYTVRVSGVNNTVGEALVEVYELP